MVEQIDPQDGRIKGLPLHPRMVGRILEQPLESTWVTALESYEDAPVFMLPRRETLRAPWCFLALLMLSTRVEFGPGLEEVLSLVSPLVARQWDMRGKTSGYYPGMAVELERKGRGGGEEKGDDNEEEEDPVEWILENTSEDFREIMAGGWRRRGGEDGRRPSIRAIPPQKTGKTSLLCCLSPRPDPHGPPPGPPPSPSSPTQEEDPLPGWDPRNRYPIPRAPPVPRGRRTNPGARGRDDAIRPTPGVQSVA